MRIPAALNFQHMGNGMNGGSLFLSSMRNPGICVLLIMRRQCSTRFNQSHGQSHMCIELGGVRRRRIRTSGSLRKSLTLACCVGPTP